MICAVAAAAALMEPSREALIERWLHANRAHVATRLETQSSSAPPPRDLQALAQRELAVAGRYQLGEPPPAPESWWSRALDWLRDRWSQLWRRIFARVHVGRTGVARIGDALLVIVGLLFLFVAFRLLRNLRLARSHSRATSVPLDAPPDPGALYQAACNAANSGEFGTAALLLFAATIAVLDGRGAVTCSRSATVGELRRQLRTSDAALIAPFDAVAAPFVRTAYAERPVDEPQWRRAREAFAALRQAAA